MYFVCRWREESPFSKRVVTLPDVTVLGWFRRGWDQPDPETWIDRELGGHVYGLETIFEKAPFRHLPRPETIDQLRGLLHEHLWVEGDADFIRLNDHALRVRTDDDEVDLAYYFVDDQAVAADPDRYAFLVHDTWPLPAEAAESGAVFDPGAPVRTVGLAPPGPQTVYSVRLCWESPDTVRNLELAGAVAFPGLSLPDLAVHLRDLDVAAADHWPHDVRLLRSLVASGEDHIGPAMRRYAQLPGHQPSPNIMLRESPQGTSRPQAPQLTPPPTRSLVQVDRHIAQVARHIDNFFGFDQWFLFDTRWAAARPNLASSLLHYAAHWDPCQAPDDA